VKHASDQTSAQSRALTCWGAALFLERENGTCDFHCNFEKTSEKCRFVLPDENTMMASEKDSVYCCVA